MGRRYSIRSHWASRDTGVSTWSEDEERGSSDQIFVPRCCLEQRTAAYLRSQGPNQCHKVAQYLGHVRCSCSAWAWNWPALLLLSIWKSMTLEGSQKYHNAPVNMLPISPTAPLWWAQKIFAWERFYTGQSVSCVCFIFNGLCVQIFLLPFISCLTLRNHLGSMSLNFIICLIDMTTVVTTSYDCSETKWQGIKNI